jgi:hypothetical protein
MAKSAPLLTAQANECVCHQAEKHQEMTHDAMRYDVTINTPIELLNMKRISSRYRLYFSSIVLMLEAKHIQQHNDSSRSDRLTTQKTFSSHRPSEERQNDDDRFRCF